ncbi:sigma-54 dependent transcriptional regulator [Acidobacteria bacterium AH-259-A15]|nr:sigma-54 dependent transcriptional regulator [Acidobacteria bacterium AH-259-A15]
MKTSDSAAPRILVADDQVDVLESLRLLLKGEGYEIEAVQSPAAVLNSVEAEDFDVALMDLNYARDTTSGQEGLDLLARIQAIDSTLPVVVMTAWGSIELAVEAMRRGARDFIKKPWDNERLLSILRTQVELCRALRRGQRLEAENQLLRGQGSPELVARSPVMQPVLELIAKVGPSDANLLITGEHGAGKDIVARTVHSLSNRSDKPLVTVNLGGLSEGTFVSELFGHVKGAYTDARTDRVGRFELADKGTLFLDEITNVPFGQQANLLRVIETGEMEKVGSSKTIRVDVRIISATNAKLEEEVASGNFREDLLFRLNTVEIHLPPLKERPEDISLLAMHFLGRYSEKYRKQLTDFDGAAMRALLAHSWPGNVRELDHVVERAALMARDTVVKADDLGLGGRGDSQRLEDMGLEEVERLLVQKALTRFSGNVSEAARALGLSRSALYRRMEKYGL